MTKVFSSKVIRLAGTAVLASILATSVGAADRFGSAEPKTMVLFFDSESAALSPEAKSIVLSAVDAAERAHAGQIELAAHSSFDESVHDAALAARRAEAVKELIVEYGFRGYVFVDEEAPAIPLVRAGDETFDRSAILRLAQ